jgi:hypothetical protein
MGLHDAAIAIACEQGCLSYPEVKLIRERAPTWFLRLADPEGIAEYEARAGVCLPRAVVDFYAATDLVCFLEAAFDAGHFDVHTNAKQHRLNPPIEERFGRKYVFVDEHWHSASRGCVPLDAGDDPPVYGSIAGDPLFELAPRFTKYVRDQIEGYDRLLQHCKEMHAAHLGTADELHYGWVTRLPGFDRSPT